MNTDGSEIKCLIDLDGAIYPSWASDSDRIIFSALVNGSSEMFTVDSKGENLKRLTYNEVDDQFATFSPDGESIAFSTLDPVTHFDICLMDNNGNDIIKLIDHSGSDEFPRWSPDGNQFVFRSSITGSDQITVMNRDGTEIRAITQLLSQSMPYDWR
jgi:TolB protein